MRFLSANADSARTSGSHVSSCGGDGYFTRPKPCLPPKSCIPSTVSTLHLVKPRGSDHCILGDNLREFLLRPANGRRWLDGQHHVAVIGRGVPDSDFSGGGEIETHFTQDGTRLPDDACPVVDILVPIGGSADDGIGGAGAERADDHVVNVRRVLEYDELPMVFRELEAHLLRRRPPVRKHSHAKFGVNPG